jgi:RNA polymerase sigma factor (TIGR02999 family)
MPPHGHDSRALRLTAGARDLLRRIVTMGEQQHAVTQALIGAASGDTDAARRLWDLTYDELHRIAQHHLRGERADHTLSATALVHEAFVRLVDQDRIVWTDRGHFFGVASRACRRVLVDHARKRNAQKRGGGGAKITLDEALVGIDSQADEVLALNEALDRLSAMDERLGQVVEMRYFGGLSEEETAEALGITPRTVRRDWVKAKGWLFRELSVADPPEADASP